MKRLLVFDVDGTLVPDSEKITKRNILAINERLKAGDVVAIASGRPYSGIKVFLDQLCEGEKYAIGANGAAVYSYEGELLDSHGLSSEDFLEFYNRHLDTVEAGIPMYCYTGEGIGYYSYNWAVDWEIKINRMIGRNLNEFPLDKNDVILKFMIAALEPEIIDAFKLEKEDEKYTHLRTDPCYLEFVHPKTDKAVGVEFLRKKLGLNIENVFTFGDQGNDVKMISNFMGIAMENGIKECKINAKYITVKCEDSGVADAIYNFVLKQ